MHQELKKMSKETKCCKCNKKAIGYFGVGEPDIKPIPLCEDCKIKMQMELFELMEKYRE